MITRKTVTRSLSIALAAGSFVALAGCLTFNGQRAQGRAASLDMTVLESTSFEPKTATVIDVRDQQEIFSMEIPVGYKLIMRFYDDRLEDPYMPAVMRWDVVETTNSFTSLRNRIPAPPVGSRRIEWTLRSSPEQPPEEPLPTLRVDDPTLDAPAPFQPPRRDDPLGTAPILDAPVLRDDDPNDPFDELLFRYDPGPAPQETGAPIGGPAEDPFAQQAAPIAPAPTPRAVPQPVPQPEEPAGEEPPIDLPDG